MKNNVRFFHWFWLLGLFYSLNLDAQYTVNVCEQVNNTTVINQPLLRVSSGGAFINRATVNYRGVNSIFNEGGFSESSANCVALYASPCSQSAGSSGMNVFGADMALTTISGSSPVRMYAVELARDITLENEWQIVSAFDWQGGMVATDKSQPTYRLHWLGGSYTGADASRHVNGYAAWSGNGYFSLPVGDGTKMQPLGVVGDCSTTFGGAYFSGDPGSASLPTGAPFSTSSIGEDVGSISQQEYWDVNGSDSTKITLHFDASSNLSALADSLSEVIVVGWDGSQWVALGSSARTGTLTGTGTVTSENVVPDDYLAFTFASGISCQPFVSGAIATDGETICEGGTPGEIGSTTAASGGDNSITYSWRSSADNYTSAINGATSATYTPPSGLTSTTTYRRYAQDGSCNTTATASTGDWTVTVQPSFTSGAIATTGETICEGNTPGEIGSTTAASGGDNSITYSWRSSADNYTAAINGATSATYTPPSGLTSTTTYRRYAQDGSCNTTATASTGDWMVTVRSAPGLVCPANLSINTSDGGTGNCTGTANWLHPTETNGACAPLTLNMSVNGTTATPVQAGSAQSLTLATGMHTIAYTLTDGGGNSTACSFTITVVDNEAPTISCINRTLIFGGQANLPLSAADLATAADNCGVSSLQSSLTLVSCNLVGQTLTATLQVTDVNGLVANCQSQVTITGLACGWEAQEDGVNCEDGNIASYNPMTQVYTLTSINCHTPIGSHIADGGAFMQRTLCGNSSITALVSSINGDLGWAGLIMRESNAPGAKKVSLVTDRNFNHRREVRAVANTLVRPLYWRGLNRYWLRLLRVNQQVVGYISTNGANWQQVMVGSVQMNSCVEVGLWAFNSNPTGTLTATFSHVSTTGNMIMNTLQEIPQGVEAAAEQATNFAVFPNPSAGDFFLDLSAYRDQSLQLRVLDMLGREVYRQSLELITEDVHSLVLPETIKAGFYQLSLESDVIGTHTAKIVLVRE